MINRKQFFRKAIQFGVVTVPAFITACGYFLNDDDDSSGSASPSSGGGTNSTGSFPLFPILQDTSGATEYTLPAITISEQQHDFNGSGTVSDSIALRTPDISDGTYGGPVIRVTKGDSVTFNFTNNLPEPTSNHWHGLHIVGQVDGSPHQRIDSSGGTWSVNLKIQQEASTNWYHSHEHHATQRLVNKGHVGMFIVDDANANALDIPKTMNTDDFPVLVKYQAFEDNGTIKLTGGGGSNKMLANGKENGGTLMVEQKWIRIRVLNGSDGQAARSLNFKMSDNRTFYQIATDGGFLDTPVLVSEFMMSPAERCEFLIDFTQESVGSELILQATPDIAGGGNQGAATENLTVFTFKVKANDSGEQGITSFNSNMNLRGSNGTETINWSQVNTNAATLKNNPVVSLSVRVGNNGASNTVTCEGNIANNTGTSDNVLTNTPASYTQALVGIDSDGTAVSMNMNRVNFSVRKNLWQVWRFRSANHPLHVHGCSFLILSIDGQEPSDQYKGWKDTIFPTVGGGGNDALFLVKFNYHTYSSSLTTSQSESDATTSSSPSFGVIGTNGSITNYDPYMFHCHFLHHEDGGMMGQFNAVHTNQTT